MKWGLVARACNSGLGSVSWEFHDQLKPLKTVVIVNGTYQTFMERFPDAMGPFAPSQWDDARMNEFLDGLDLVLIVETAYNDNLFGLARKRGVRTVLIPMYECLQIEHPKPDLYACPSLLDLKEMPENANKVFLPVPVNTERISFRERTQAKVFVHNAGHGGLLGRNGTAELLEAMKYVNADIKLIVNAQFPLTYDDPRVEIRSANYRNYWQLWQEGDVFVFPHKFDGLSLPIQEALASGMPLVTTSIYPFTEWIPEEYRFDPQRLLQIRLQRPLEMAVIDPRALADAIDRMANSPRITEYSRQSRAIAEGLSWDAWRDVWLKTFNEL